MAFQLSVLDLVPVGTGFSSAQAVRNSVDLAQLADRLGYSRYWLAEHHNMPGIASSAPEILIGHLAGVTSNIRVGSGGIMLPNHSPLKVAETFMLLEALYPGRIDLGIGRAPGTDGATALALRRSRARLSADDFPEQLAELLAFATGTFPDGHPFQSVRAVPVDSTLPPIWLLGSSDFGAQAAAALGVGFAFAAHINPGMAVAAIHAYRQGFMPSADLREPRTILTLSVICAESDQHATYLASSLDLTYLLLRTNRPGKLPSPAEALAYPYTATERAVVDASRARFIAGSPATVKSRIDELVAETGADEVMITTMVYDHAERLQSYRLLAEAFGLPRRGSGSAEKGVDPRRQGARGRRAAHGPVGIAGCPWLCT